MGHARPDGPGARRAGPAPRPPPPAPPRRRRGAGLVAGGAPRARAHPAAARRDARARAGLARARSRRGRRRRSRAPPARDLPPPRAAGRPVLVGGAAVPRDRLRRDAAQHRPRRRIRRSAPSRGERMNTRPRPILRRLAVTVSFAVAMLGTAVGVGAFGGTPMQEAAGGLLGADATHLAPATPAFMLWSVIYVGLGAYCLWQWWDPADARGIAVPAIASLLLNAAWL